MHRATYERLSSNGTVTHSIMFSSPDDDTEPFVDVAESRDRIDELAFRLIMRSCWNMLDLCEAKEKFAEVKESFAVRRKMLDTLMDHYYPEKTHRLDRLFDAMCSGEYWNSPESY